MPNKNPEPNPEPEHGSVGSWAKRCYLAGRMVMEAALRPHELGSTQWYVLHQLANEGPIMQRDLLRMLQVERATLSAIVRTMVQKGLVEQVPDRRDQRQKLLRLTRAGTKLWNRLPDLSFINKVAFEGIDDAEIATAIKVLRTATERLMEFAQKETDT